MIVRFHLDDEAITLQTKCIHAMSKLNYIKAATHVGTRPLNTSTITVIPGVLLDTYVSARYCTKLIRGEIAPRLATWLIFEVGVLMSLAAYFASHEHSLTKAALNATDAVMLTVILLLVLIKQTGRSFQFTNLG